MATAPKATRHAKGTIRLHWDRIATAAVVGRPPETAVEVEVAVEVMDKMVAMTVPAVRMEAITGGPSTDPLSGPRETIRRIRIMT
jgi:hypothetical protein